MRAIRNDREMLSEDVDEVIRRLAGPNASIAAVTGLAGGQHGTTWKVETYNNAPLGRSDLDPEELRRRHADWSAALR